MFQPFITCLYCYRIAVCLYVGKVICNVLVTAQVHSTGKLLCHSGRYRFKCFHVLLWLILPCPLFFTSMNNVFRYERVMIIDDSNIDRFVAEKVIRQTYFAGEIITMPSAQLALDYLRVITDETSLPGIISLISTCRT